MLKVQVVFACLLISGCSSENNSEPDSGAGHTQATLEFQYDFMDHPYEAVARQAAIRYRGLVEPSVINLNNAGQLLSAVIHGPLSEPVQSPGSLIPIVDTFAGDEQYAAHDFRRARPGYPMALMPTFFPLHLPWFEVFRIDVAGSKDCVAGGYFAWSEPLSSVTSDISEERSISFANCEYGDLTVSGSVRVRRDLLSNEDYAYSIAYDGMSLTTTDDVINIVGVDTLPNGEGCDVSQPRHSYLLIESTQANRAILLANMKAAVLGFEPSYPYLCAGDGRHANYFSGQIFHSQYGSVDVSTPNYLGYTRMLEKRSSYFSTDGRLSDLADDYRNQDLQLPQQWGTLNLQGAQESSVSLSIENWSRFAELADLENYQVSFQNSYVIDVNPRDLSASTFRFSQDDIWSGALGDMSDADEDGAPHMWEIIHGLDPESGIEAGFDRDRDGLSDSEEVKRGTSPNIANPIDAIIEDSVLVRITRSPGNTTVMETIDSGEYSELEIPVVVTDSRFRDNLIVSIPPLNSELRQTLHQFIVSIQGKPQFYSSQSEAILLGSDDNDPNAYRSGLQCEMSDDARELKCTLNADELCDEAERHPNRDMYNCVIGGTRELVFPILDTSVDPYTLTMNITPGVLDIDQANDTLTFSRQ